MRIPLHLKPTDRSIESLQLRATHAQNMMQMSGGRGFRQIPDNSNKMSLVEKYLVEAGDMAPPKPVYSGRKYKVN